MTPRIVPARIVRSRSRTTTRSPKARDTASAVTTASVGSGAGGAAARRDGGGADGGSAVARSCSDGPGSVTNLLLGLVSWRRGSQALRGRAGGEYPRQLIPSSPAGRGRAIRPHDGPQRPGACNAPATDRRPRWATARHRPAGDPPPVTDQTETTARLRHSTDAKPGIRRRRAGRGFTYVDPDGRRIRDRETLDRIRSLAIPPAWNDVWICPDPLGHLQATGRDARGRKQSTATTPATGPRRESAKYERLIAFARALPAIRAPRRPRPRPAGPAAREGPRGGRPAARAHADPGRQRRVRPAEPLVRADDAPRPPRVGSRLVDHASGSAASRA